MKMAIVKCRLKDRENFERKLSDIELDFSPIYWQHDRVYVPRGYKHGANLPRLILRTEMKAVDDTPVYSLILKRHIEDSGVDVVERMGTMDYQSAVNVILQLGFKLADEISRRRQELSLGDGDMVYLDEIDGANAVYAKIESQIAEGDTVAEAIEDLRKTFRVLGENDYVETAYFEL